MSRRVTVGEHSVDSWNDLNVSLVHLVFDLRAIELTFDVAGGTECVWVLRPPALSGLYVKGGLREQADAPRMVEVKM